jgi:hypothetical protein
MADMVHMPYMAHMAHVAHLNDRVDHLYAAGPVPGEPRGGCERQHRVGHGGAQGGARRV